MLIVYSVNSTDHSSPYLFLQIFQSEDSEAISDFSNSLMYMYVVLVYPHCGSFNPNLGGLFRGSFWGAGGGVKLPPPLSKTC